MIWSTPRSSAWRIRSPVPNVVVNRIAFFLLQQLQARGCCHFKERNTAIVGRAISRINGPRQRITYGNISIMPPLNVVKSSHVPSPPSANGRATIWIMIFDLSSPDNYLHTSWADRDPLNLSGAIRMIIGVMSYELGVRGESRAWCVNPQITDYKASESCVTPAPHTNS